MEFLSWDYDILNWMEKWSKCFKPPTRSSFFDWWDDPCILILLMLDSPKAINIIDLQFWRDCTTHRVKWGWLIIGLTTLYINIYIYNYIYMYILDILPFAMINPYEWTPRRFSTFGEPLESRKLHQQDFKGRCKSGTSRQGQRAMATCFMEEVCTPHHWLAA
jgi:hypothetical protein